MLVASSRADLIGRWYGIGRPFAWGPSLAMPAARELAEAQRRILNARNDGDAWVAEPLPDGATDSTMGAGNRRGS